MVYTMRKVETLHARVPGRVRYAVPALRRKPKLARELEQALQQVVGICEVKATARTGSLLIVFAPDQPSAPWQTALANLFGATQVELREPKPVPRSAARTLVVSLLGGVRRRLSVRKRPVFERAPEVESLASGPDVPQIWHTFEVPEVCALVNASEHDGLSHAEASMRLAMHGPNRLPPVPRRSELRILCDQLVSTPVLMLGATAAVSVLTGGLGESLAILAVLVINAGIGYATESGAERTISALTHTPQRAVPLLRDGSAAELDAAELVCGDLLILEAGVLVPADARVVYAQDLTVDESSLTGESVPVLKSVTRLSDEHTPLAECTNMVFRGTLVTGGSGRALVVATGADTRVGQIQVLASSIEQQSTPMQRQINHLGTQLAAGAGLACLATLVVGLLQGQKMLPMFRTAISLGVAAVPEGLPTVAITTLALGLAHMRERRVVVRQLAAVETLGAVQVLCLDKTGTVTVNRMTTVALQAGLVSYDVDQGRFRPNFARAPEGALRCDAPEFVAVSEDVRHLLTLAALCNEVTIEDRDGVRVLHGSPTESALVQVALDAALDVVQLRAAHPLLEIQRRAQARTYMTSLHAAPGGDRLLAMKGRPSEVLALCTTYLRNGKRCPLGPSELARIDADNDRMGTRSLRVLGVAYREHAEGGLIDPEDSPRDLVWVGLIGMEDPPRDGLVALMDQFHRAGVRTVMITGDQSATALAVGHQIGLANGSRPLELMDSARLDRMEPSQLASQALGVDVFARVSPAHKLQIVRALQNAGLVVAMTGDGVNDGPALKAADIGIAMGAGGSSAAREVADVVLEDDELRTLVVALEQGRTIYEDIRKAVRFILATNMSEILHTFVCVSAGLGAPLTPLQLLWINLITDVFPELALAVQPPESHVLSRPPRDPGRPMFAGDDLWRAGGEGAVITAASLSAYLWALRVHGPGRRAGTVGFMSLTLAQLLHAVSARSETHTVFDREHLARNRWLPLSICGTAGLQVAAGFVPGLRRLLDVVPLGAREWSVVGSAAVIPFVTNEVVKIARRSRTSPRSTPTLKLARAGDPASAAE